MPETNANAAVYLVFMLSSQLLRQRTGEAAMIILGRERDNRIRTNCPARPSALPALAFRSWHQTDMPTDHEMVCF
jgi:hypothetical protein